MPETTNDTLDLTTLPFWQWSIDEPTAEAIDTGIPFDSLHRPREAKDTVFRTSLFQQHTLRVQHSGNLARVDNSVPAWVFVCLILTTGLIALYFRLRKIKLIDLLKSLIDRRSMDRLIRDCNLNRTIILMPIGLLLVSAVSLPVHRMVLGMTDCWSYLALTVTVSLLYFLRNGILRLLGKSFEHRQGVALYITSNYLFHLLEAMVVVALLLPFFYLPGGQKAMFTAIAAFLAIAFVWRFARGMKVFLTLSNGSYFYLFYYLCIVELIPVLALLKWIIHSNSAS